jgi:predicted DsbA family dithiol-disulfide isomerase
VEVEIYADIWCPFAHMSLQKVKDVRDRIAPRVPLVVRAWPLEWVNGAPLDPETTAVHIAELRRDVVPTLFDGFDPGAMPTSTLRALALVEAANESDPWLGEWFSLTLREWLFERGRSIDGVMLANLARDSGLDESVIDGIGRVEKRFAEGRNRGVQGSPHFFIGDTGLFCPLLDIEADESGGLHFHERPERLEAFLRDGLAGAHDENVCPRRTGQGSRLG